MTRQDEETTLEKEVRIGWRMAGLGMEVASQVMAGALLGWLFDLWRGTAPNGLVWGGVIGIVVGLYSMIRGALRMNHQLDEARRRRHRAAGTPPPKPRPLPPEDAVEDDDWDDDAWDRWDKDDDRAQG